MNGDARDPIRLFGARPSTGRRLDEIPHRLARLSRALSHPSRARGDFVNRARQSLRRHRARARMREPAVEKRAQTSARRRARRRRRRLSHVYSFILHAHRVPVRHRRHRDVRFRVVPIERATRRAERHQRRHVQFFVGVFVSRRRRRHRSRPNPPGVASSARRVPARSCRRKSSTVVTPHARSVNPTAHTHVALARLAVASARVAVAAARQCVPGGKSLSALVLDRARATTPAVTAAEVMKAPAARASARSRARS